jgi:catalase
MSKSNERRSSGSMSFSRSLFGEKSGLIQFSFHVGNPEGIHQLIILFSDRGTPKSPRYMNAYSGHTYKFTKAVNIDYYLVAKTFSY